MTEKTNSNATTFNQTVPLIALVPSQTIFTTMPDIYRGSPLKKRSRDVSEMTVEDIVDETSV